VKRKNTKIALKFDTKTNCLWEKTKKYSEAIQWERRRPNNEKICCEVTLCWC
jgi:hypothetical protein